MDYREFHRDPGPVPVTVSEAADLTLADTAALLARILSTTDAGQIWQEVCDFFSGLGFAHVIYGYSPDSRGTVLGAPENYLILSTLPTPVMRELVSMGHFRRSVTFHWALNNVGLATFSMTEREAGVGEDFAVPPESMAFFQRNNMQTGASIGFASERTRGKAVMALIAAPGINQERVNRVLDATRDVVYAIAAVAHRCLSALPYHPPGKRLTPRQREVLEWVAEGKTTADIALIMGITPPTVEKHLRLARETLGVETTPQALVKATFLNQMFVPSPLEFGAIRAVLQGQS